VEEVLKNVKARGLDMEIAAFWTQLKIWNVNHPGKSSTPLVAVKAVSDSGPKEERNKYFKSAMGNATNFLLIYLRWIAEEGFFD